MTSCDDDVTEALPRKGLRVGSTPTVIKKQIELEKKV
jgi:hypothetical protein